VLPLNEFEASTQANRSRQAVQLETSFRKVLGSNIGRISVIFMERFLYIIDTNTRISRKSVTKYFLQIIVKASNMNHTSTYMERWKITQSPPRKTTFSVLLYAFSLEEMLNYKYKDK
jgi:hypothetical protein